jgi:hypothetical protein
MMSRAERTMLPQSYHQQIGSIMPGSLDDTIDCLSLN